MEFTVLQVTPLPTCPFTSEDEALDFIEKCGMNLAEGIGSSILEDTSENNKVGIYSVIDSSTFCENEQGAVFAGCVTIENISDDYTDLEEAHDLYQLLRSRHIELSSTWYVRMANAHKDWYAALWTFIHYPGEVIEECVDYGRA